MPATCSLGNAWATDAKRAAQQINACAETLTMRPAFREAFRAGEGEAAHGGAFSSRRAGDRPMSA